MVYSRLHLLGQLFLGWVTRWLYIPCPCFSSLLLVRLIDFETKRDWWTTFKDTFACSSTRLTYGGEKDGSCCAILTVQGWGNAPPCWCARPGSIFLSWRLTGAFQESQGFAGKLRSVWQMLGELPKRERQELVSVEKEGGSRPEYLGWRWQPALRQELGLLVQQWESGSCSSPVLLLAWLWSWAQTVSRKGVMQKHHLWSWKQ